MLFSIVVALMVILVAAFWTYQGFFSAAVMFFETLIASVIAFAFYESVNSLWVDSLGPGLGLPLALMLLFIVILVVFRTMTDKYIPGDVEFPAAVQRAGGAICGFFCGMILVGTALIAIQMLPVGSEIFTYERMSYDIKSGGPAKMGNLGIFSPDRFTYGLISMMSDGARFGTDEEHELRRTKPDLVTQLYSARAVPQSEARVFVPENALTVEAWWETDEIDSVTHKVEGGDGMIREFDTVKPNRVNNKFVVCTVEIDKSAAPKDKSEIRFRQPQFRIIGFDNGNESSQPSVWLATGMTDIYTNTHHGPKPVADRQRERLVAFSPLTDFILSPIETKVVETPKGFKFDVAFEVPQSFKPWFVEFKSGARAELFDKDEKDERKGRKLEKAPTWASVAQGKGGLSGPTKNVQVANAAPTDVWDVRSTVQLKTGFTDQLIFPVPVNDPALPPNSFTGESLGTRDGIHVTYPVPASKPISIMAQTLYTPEDKVMFQVTFDDPKKKSMWGRSIQFANRVVGQTAIVDAAGNKHYAIGQYALAQVGGEWVFEVQYWPNAEVPERALKSSPPKKVTQAVLDSAGVDNSYFGFIFLVPSDVTEIKTFEPGSGKPLDLNIKR